VVHIQVIEGYIDQVVWPAALSKYRNFFSYYASKITADRPINVKTLERYLLLASDLPGLKFKNSMKPSATEQGAATLIVEVEEKPIDYVGRVDNRGTIARGPYQYYNALTFNNPGRFHESWTFNYAGTFQFKELQYGAINYRQVLTPEGLTLFLSETVSRSKPGTQTLQLLEYQTRSDFFEGGFSYPFIRQRETNMIGTALFFMTNDRSDILDSLNTLDRLRGFRAKLDADKADSTGGINQLNLVFSQGIEGLGSTNNDSLFKSRFNGRVDFTKVEATLSRVQPLGQGFSVLGAVFGQWSRTALLSPELCGYGGRVFGRAYDPSELLGDRCVLALGELRYDVPVTLPKVTQFQLYGFADAGWLHNIAPVAGTPENVDGASVGGGLRLGLLGFQPGLTADLSAAKGVAGSRDDWRFFFIVTGRL
jgi:hemolysin activation/secretion protein